MSDNAIPEEILGDDWKKCLPDEKAAPLLNVFAPCPVEGEAGADTLYHKLEKLAKLTKMEREVFTRAWKYQETDSEIAENLGISKTAARQRLHKARRKLMEAISKI